MINLTKFKELLGLDEPTESPLESSKSPKKDFNSVGKKRAGVFHHQRFLCFVGGAEWEGGGDTSWYPFFKLADNSTSKEKGEAIIKVLDGFVVRLDYDEFHTGEIEEKELLQLSGLTDITSFYRRAKYCGFTQRKESRKIEIMPYKKERGQRNYTGLPERAVTAMIVDAEALGRALDEVIPLCI